MAEHDKNGANASAATGALPPTATNGKQRDDSGESVEEGHKFQLAIAAWRTLNLTNLVSTLDITAEDLVTHQKNALVQRKDLAQKTKDFRKLDDTQKLAEFKDLLKAYQGYVDVLTNHTKSVTSAFMQAYSPLSEAPDPYPLLEASVESLVTAEEVVPRLEEENARLQKQVTKLTSQLEESEKQLEQERNKRQMLESEQDAKIKEVEKTWAEVLQEKEEHWSVKEKSLDEKVESQDRLLKELKASYEVNQRLELSGGDTQDSGRSAAYAAELEIANTELEKTNMRLVELQARNEQLRLDLARSASQANSSSKSVSVEDDPAYLRLRSENSSLLRKLDSAKDLRVAESSKTESKLRGVEREIAALTVDRDALQAKVTKWADYDEVRRELDMLRAIEFATVDEDSGDIDETRTSAAGATLEKLLVARNKKISDDLTELRVAHNELQHRFEALQQDLSDTNMQLEKTLNLNATLENDLQKTHQEVSSAFETMSVAGTYTSRYPKSSYGSRRGVPSPTSSIIGGFDPSSNGRGNDGAVGGGSSILPMITAQRDRFKKKIGELEQELQKQYQAVSSLRSEIASLQKDNLSLYEKTRYVSSYNRVPPPANPNPATINIAGSSSTSSGLSLDRYKSAYESNLSPFAAFRGRESARVLRGMTMPERLVFRITKTVLATRTSRNLFAVYCFALHILVFMMLFGPGSEPAIHSASHFSSGAGHAEWKPQGFRADDPLERR